MNTELKKFHPCIQSISDRATAVDANGTIRTELILTVSVPLDPDESGYDEATASSLIDATVEYLKRNTQFDGAVFHSVRDQPARKH